MTLQKSKWQTSLKLLMRNKKTQADLRRKLVKTSEDFATAPNGNENKNVQRNV
tara:strand:+ start:15304 stop:15462 length:159 start_codon:yes stop_codon:yes gene_type:complete